MFSRLPVTKVRNDVSRYQELLLRRNALHGYRLFVLKSVENRTEKWIVRFPGRQYLILSEISSERKIWSGLMLYAPGRNLVFLVLLCTGLSCSTRGMQSALTGRDARDASRLSVQPEGVYPGENVFVLSSVGGLRNVKLYLGDYERKDLIVSSGFGEVYGCPQEHRVKITINSLDVPSIRIRAKNCRGQDLPELRLERKDGLWRADHYEFPEARVGETVCMLMQVSAGTDQILDTIFVPDSVPVEFRFHRSLGMFPLHLPSRSVLRYTVCFKSDRPGEYVFPIITMMRREDPFEHLTSYPVADTAYVKVNEW